MSKKMGRNQRRRARAEAFAREQNKPRVAAKHVPSPTTNRRQTVFAPIDSEITNPATKQEHVAKKRVVKIDTPKIKKSKYERRMERQKGRQS